MRRLFDRGQRLQAKANVDGKGLPLYARGGAADRQDVGCGNFLADRLEELDANEVRLAGFLLALDTRLDGGHPGRYQAG